MNNPFEAINQRLANIETLLLDIKHQPKEEKKSENLTVKETAEVLKVSEQTIHNYIKKGFIQAQKMGRILLIKRADLAEALTEVKSLKYRRA